MNELAQTQGAWYQVAPREIITSGAPGWAPYGAERRATALLTESVTPADDPAGDERALWEGIR